MSEEVSERADEKARPMTIGVCQGLFKKYSDEFLPDHEDLVRLFRRHRLDHAIHNENYLHALSLTDLLFQHTNRSFRMLTGSAGDGFLTCLRDSFVAMLRRLRNSKNKARVIVVNDSTAKPQPFLGEFDEFKDTLTVIQAESTSDARIAHFIVGDDDMVRDEAIHSPLTKDSNANEIKADVYFANKIEADIFSRKFDIYWNGLSAPTPN